MRAAAQCVGPVAVEYVQQAREDKRRSLVRRRVFLEETACEQDFIQCPRVVILRKRSIEPDRIGVVPLCTRRVLRPDEMFERIEHGQTFVGHCRVELGRRDGHRHRADVEAPCRDAAQRRFECNGSHPAERVQKALPGTCEGPDQMMGERWFQLALIGAERVQRASPVALGEVALLVGQVALERLPPRSPRWLGARRSMCT